MTQFSIVMPTYNSEKYVGEAIESVLSQSLEDWELLVVDDCSVDNTVDILRDFESRDRRIRIFRQQSNLGPAKSRNLAISEAAGRYIAFLDSDDLWRSEKLQRQLDHFQYTGAPLVYSAYEKIDESGERNGRVVSVPESIDDAGYQNAPGLCSLAEDFAARWKGAGNNGTFGVPAQEIRILIQQQVEGRLFCLACVSGIRTTVCSG